MLDDEGLVRIHCSLQLASSASMRHGQLSLPSAAAMKALRRKLDMGKDGRFTKQATLKALCAGFIVPAAPKTKKKGKSVATQMAEEAAFGNSSSGSSGGGGGGGSGEGAGGGGARGGGGGGGAESQVEASLLRMAQVSRGIHYERQWRRLIQSFRSRHGDEMRLYK